MLCNLNCPHGHANPPRSPAAFAVWLAGRQALHRAHLALREDGGPKALLPRRCGIASFEEKRTWETIVIKLKRLGNLGGQGKLQIFLRFGLIALYNNSNNCWFMVDISIININ